MLNFLANERSRDLPGSSNTLAPAFKAAETERPEVSARSGKPATAQPKKTELMAAVLYESPTEKAACEKEPACRKLGKEYLSSIVKVVGDRGDGGTGWIGPDGRVITAEHVVAGNKMLVAIDQTGKRYRLGKNSTVDTASDLAALDFVGERPTVAKPLVLASRAPRLGETMYSLNHTGLQPLQLQRGNYLFSKDGVEFSQQQDKDGRHALYLRRLAKESPASYNYYVQQLSRTFDMVKIGARHGASGGPIFNSEGEVSSVVSRGSVERKLNLTTRLADIEELLKKPATHSVSIESSASLFMQNASHTEKGLLGFKLGMTAIGGEALRTGVGGRLTPIVAGALVFNQGVSDSYRLQSSSDFRDRLKYGYALGADSVMIGGLATSFLSRKGAIGLGITAAGFLMRASAEFIPNEYVFRSNGS